MPAKQGEAAPQTSLHAFFKPKPTPSHAAGAHIIDLTSPPPKRAKLNPPTTDPLTRLSSAYFDRPEINVVPSTQLESFRLPKIGSIVRSASGSAFDTFSLGDYVNPPVPTQRSADQERKHETWKRLELVPGGVVPHHKSPEFDEAAALESRRPAGLDDGGIEEEEEFSEISTEEFRSVLKSKYGVKADPPTSKGKHQRGKKKVAEVGPSGMTYSPLEKQFVEIKAQWPDVLLLMEVGYKYKFHGDDAKTASKELGIAVFPNRNFYTASIPTHRLHIHVKKLISLGYKVGVISQMETAALKKVGDNRNAPFVRELTHLYTAATYVEEISSYSSNLRDEPLLFGATPPPTNALIAIVEQGGGGTTVDGRARIALVSIVPGTGDVVWDEFDDSLVRSEFETRLAHLQPAELLLPLSGLSKPTEKIIKLFIESSSSIRIERIKNIPVYESAFDHLSDFYVRKSVKDVTMTDPTNEYGTESEETILPEQSENELDSIRLAAGLPSEEEVLTLINLPKQVVVSLSMVVEYLTTFGLQNVFRHRSSFSKFINHTHMLLSSNTLDNLEIYRNQTDGGMYGSLLWLLDQTKTRMGRRLMREWIGRPLLDINALRARIDAVDELRTNDQYHVEKLRSLLVNMPDLVRGLTRIQYGKAMPTELASILVGLVRVASEFKSDEDSPFSSEMLNSILRSLPTILETSQRLLRAINIKAAKDNDEANLWTDPDRYPEIQDAKDCISVCESELNQHLKEVRKLLKRPSLNYITVSGIENLIELPIRDSKTVPPKWVKISSTKSVVRFHSPEILKMVKEREQHKETLASAARRAFLSFQSDISECHQLIVVSRQLAVIDCLISLATVALASGYSKPTFVTKPQLVIKNGRHPMVEALREEGYVPFDIEFSNAEGTTKVITGPNMAGKSSCVRATALIVCMAQIGSFVPASSATLGIHDAVQTRMGASDEIDRGKSTFMVELSETSDILRTVTPKTLVILDELGRGTSTYDGAAIAYATLSHLAGVGCDTLFITHYPMVAEQLAKEYPKQISNWHMSFDEVTAPDGSAEITFLYKLSRGLAEASFGVWCAQLAGLPKPVLVNAQSRANELKIRTEDRIMLSLSRRTRLLINDCTHCDTPASNVLRNAMVLMKTLQFVRS